MALRICCSPCQLLLKSSKYHPISIFGYSSVLLLLLRLEDECWEGGKVYLQDRRLLRMPPAQSFSLYPAPQAQQLAQEAASKQDSTVMLVCFFVCQFENVTLTLCRLQKEKEKPACQNTKNHFTFCFTSCYTLKSISTLH